MTLLERDKEVARAVHIEKKTDPRIAAGLLPRRAGKRGRTYDYMCRKLLEVQRRDKFGIILEFELIPKLYESVHATDSMQDAKAARRAIT